MSKSKDNVYRYRVNANSSERIDGQVLVKITRVVDGNKFTRVSKVLDYVMPVFDGFEAVMESHLAQDGFQGEGSKWERDYATKDMVRYYTEHYASLFCSDVSSELYSDGRMVMYFL